MKHITQLLLFSLFTIHVAVAQNIACRTNSASFSSVNSIQQSCPSNGGPTGIEYYIPNITAMPTLTFNVNFVFLDDPDPTKLAPYEPHSAASLSVDCQTAINLLNTTYATIGNNAHFLTPLNPSPLVPESKIRFKLNKVYKISDSNGTIPCPPSGTIFPGYATSFLSAFGQDQSTCINLVFANFAANCTIGFSAEAHEMGSIYMGQIGTGPYALGGTILPVSLLAHEMGHTLGRLPDYYATNTIMPVPASVLNFTYMQNNSNPLVGFGYSPDDSSPEVIPSADCSNTTSPTYIYRNNNLMGNNCSPKILSAKQIAAFHYLVANNVTKKYTQFNGLPYPYIPNITQNYTFTGTASYTNQTFSFNQIVIPTGADITFIGCSFGGGSASRIIVEPGAKLTLSACDLSAIEPHKTWRGIEVRGNPYLPQIAQNQGLLEMSFTCISNAQVAVLAGARAGGNDFLFQNYWGGGIIHIGSCNFVNNYRHIYMQTYSPPNNTQNNFSYISSNTFFTDASISQYIGGPFYQYKNQITLRGIRRITINDNVFNLSNKAAGSEDSITAIKGINSSINYNGGSGAISANFDFGIFLTNPLHNNVIQDAMIRSLHGIYISGGNFDKIVRCKFINNFFPNPNLPNSVGVYLDNCNNYKVENNEFKPFTKPNSWGIIANNSGPYPNKLYNNRFENLAQGIWCQNQNYNPITGVGLVLNCNDFINTDYNIGVQSPFFPPAINPPGIGEYQGVINTPLLNVRNTYGTPNCSNANKYYSYTPFNLPPQIKHGNFLGTQFRVGPQPSCSDGVEIDDIVGNPPLGQKPSYCPDNSNLPAQKINHTGNISLLSAELATLTAFYNTNLDGGDTQTLLNLVNSNNSPGQIKNQLLAATFLSDTVLTAYFTKASTPAGHAKQVHQKNAPVSREVWQILVAKNYPNGIFNQMQQAQNTGALSPRQNTVATIQLTKNNLSYEIMHKSMALLADTVGNIKDSLAALIVLNNQADVPKQLIELDINFNQYKQANEKAIAYISKADGNLSKLQYGEFIKLYCKIMTDEGLESLSQQAQLKEEILKVANNPSHPCQYKARNIMSSLFNYPHEVLALSPVTNSARLAHAKASNDEQRYNNLVADMLSLYPNPTTSNCTINNQSPDVLSVKVLSINGQVLLQQVIEANKESTIKTDILPNGIYIVYLNNQKGETIKTQKLVIVK